MFEIVKEKQFRSCSASLFVSQPHSQEDNNKLIYTANKDIKMLKHKIKNDNKLHNFIFLNSGYITDIECIFLMFRYIARKSLGLFVLQNCNK